jgi:hypothetical protein
MGLPGLFRKQLARLVLLAWATTSCNAVYIDDVDPIVQYSTGAIGWDHINSSIDPFAANISFEHT